MSDLDKWRRAAEAARKLEHHFPADCLAEAISEVESLRAKLAAVEALAEAIMFPEDAEPERTQILAAIHSQESPNGSHGHDDDRTVVTPPTAGSTE